MNGGPSLFPTTLCVALCVLFRQGHVQGRASLNRDGDVEWCCVLQCHAMPCHAVLCCALLRRAARRRMCVSGAACQIGWSLRRLRRGRLGRLGPRSSLAWHPARITSIARIRSTLATLNVPVHCPHCQMFGGTCRRSRCIDLVRKLVGYPLQVLEESIGRSLGNVTVALTWLSLACSVRIDVSRFLPIVKPTRHFGSAANQLDPHGQVKLATSAEPSFCELQTRSSSWKFMR